MADLPIPRDDEGRITLAVDVSPWLRPDAPTSGERLFCHCYGRGKGSAQMIPGWPYSFVAALETGRTSWTTILDAQRLGPSDDPTEVTAAQVRELIERLRVAGRHRDSDPDILVVFDAGYDVTRLAHLLADLPVELLGRVRSNRAYRLPAPEHRSGVGRPPRHGPEFKLDQPDSQPEPAFSTSSDTDRYGAATATAWHRAHPRLARRGGWARHDRCCRSSRAPSSGYRSTGYPATVSPNRCGCGTPTPSDTGRHGAALADVPAPLRH